MIISGIDINTRYIAQVDMLDGYWHQSFLMPPKVARGASAWDRCMYIYKGYQSYISRLRPLNRPSWVYLEDVPHVRNVQTLKDMQSVMTAVRLVLDEFQIPHTLVNVSTWKKQTIGNGRADKDQVKAWALTHIRNIPTDLKEDEYDASVIAFMGAVAAGHTPKAPETESD